MFECTVTMATHTKAAINQWGNENRFSCYYDNHPPRQASFKVKVAEDATDLQFKSNFCAADMELFYQLTVKKQSTILFHHS